MAQNLTRTNLPDVTSRELGYDANDPYSLGRNYRVAQLREALPLGLPEAGVAGLIGGGTVGAVTGGPTLALLTKKGRQKAADMFGQHVSDVMETVDDVYNNDYIPGKEEYDDYIQRLKGLRNKAKILERGGDPALQEDLERLFGHKNRLGVNVRSPNPMNRNQARRSLEKSLQLLDSDPDYRLPRIPTKATRWTNVIDRFTGRGAYKGIPAPTALSRIAPRIVKGGAKWGLTASAVLMLLKAAYNATQYGAGRIAAPVSAAPNAVSRNAFMQGYSKS